MRLQRLDSDMEKMEMRKQVKVSVIIPIYNVEDYLRECIESVVHQTLREIEIICVNDGTRDNSMDIVREYASGDSRIIIVNKANGGLSSARNYGMDIASGEYLYFLDSDDYLKPQALEKLYDLSKENDLDNIFFSAETFFESEEVKEKNRNYITYYNRSREYPKVYTGQELFTLMEEKGDFRPSACLQMPKKRLLDQYGIRFYEGILHEDNLFSLQNMTVSQRVMCISDKLYMRRMREESIMTSAKELKKSVGYFITIKEYFSFIKDMELPEDFSEALIKRMRKLYGHVIQMGQNATEEAVFRAFRNGSIQDAMQYLVYAKTASELKKKEAKRAKQNREIKNSYSYKIGRVLVYIPGKLKKVLKKLI